MAATLEGVIRGWSPEAEELCGYAATEVIGRHVSMLSPPERTPEGELVLDRVRRGVPVRGLRASLRHKGGKPLEVVLTLSPFWDERGAVVGFSAAAQDLRTKREKELARQHFEELSALIEHLPVGMRWVGRDGTILRANREALDQLGYAPGEYVGHTLSEFHVDPQAVGEILGHLARGEPMVDYETRLRAKDGSVKTVLITSSVIRREDQVIHAECFTKDITELRQNQRQKEELHHELEAEHRRLRASLEQMPAGVIVAEAPSGRVVMANREVDRIFRLHFSRASSIREYGIDQRVHLDGRPYTLEEWPLSRSLRTGEVVQAEEIRILRGDGTWSTILVNAAPIRDAQGAAFGAVATFQDIGELKEKDAEIRRLNEDLERRVRERTRELEEVVAELNTFTYTVSHDLRSPLRSIRSLASIVAQDWETALGPEGLEYLDRISRSAERLDQVTHDLLSYTRVAHGSADLQAVDLGELAEDVLGLADQDLKERGARVDVARPLGRALAHPVMLKEVLANLLSNAVKFMAPGVSPRVRIATEEVSGGRVRLVVADNGIGIPPEYRERIFRIFERLHSSDQYPGTGIGLAIAKKAVERMGGSIGVESAPGGGSRFWIDLERAPEPGEPGDPPPSAPLPREEP